MEATRLKIYITGRVQGVGFRAQAFYTAEQLNLTGFAQNNGPGVLIEIQGSRCDEFLPQLMANLSAPAKVDSVESNVIPIKKDETIFQIIASSM